ncbi:MAG: aminotransferase class I/II-fold pyridoxal phosphate-dependent enzyme [Planctomycetales bacterium]|nr:aminotransferase class I/II-fold pyridoxal phosphate-dependent enzyme [Planctomycetales bacterium]
MAGPSGEHVPGRMNRDLGRAAETALSPPIFLSSVYRCDDPAQAAAMLSGESDGYVYQRDRHPNGDLLAAQICELHQADWAVVTGSGMAALSAAVLATVNAGQHVVVSSQLYGKSTHLLTQHAARVGIETSVVDTFDLAAVRESIRPSTRLIVVETLTNPVLRVAPLEELAELARHARVELLVDNTFASPVLCRPLQWQANLVMESLSKVMNGHSDVMLGALCGRGNRLAAMRDVVSSWGLACSPFDAWLGSRGLQTVSLRVERASQNALRIAKHLQQHAAVSRVEYPGLATHVDFNRTQRLFNRGENGDLLAGTMVAFELSDGDAATRFIRAGQEIPFCPSLGEVSTTLSHPASTSHRALSAAQRRELGIGDGMIRLSVGTESCERICELMDRMLVAT